MSGAWFHIYSKSCERVQEHTHPPCRARPGQRELCHQHPRALPSGQTGSPLGIKWLNWDGDQGREEKPLTGLTLNPRWHFFHFPCQEEQQGTLDTRWAWLPSAHTVAALQSLPGSCDSPEATSGLLVPRQKISPHPQEAWRYLCIICTFMWSFFFPQIVLPRRRKEEAKIFSHLKMHY